MEIANMEHQVMDTQLDVSLICPKSMQQQEEKKPRPQPEQALKCPRCDSTNTKFCYYNNYSLSQPRYFCKGCRRYWTKGGSLRNVPVGGGCRKNNKRSASSSNSSSSSSSSKKSQDQELTINNSNPFSNLPALPLPPLSFDPNDLTLAFASLQNQATIENNDANFMLGNLNPSTNTQNATGTFLDILRNGFVDNCNGNTNGSYNQNFYYGFGGNVEDVEGGDGHTMFPFGGGLMNNMNNSGTQGATTNNCKVTDNVDDHNGNDQGNLGVESTRDYWGNGVGSSWHGLINSSLI